MVNPNSQGYRLRKEENTTICLGRSDDQIIYDFINNKRNCREQGFSPTTSKNTGRNSYRKRKKVDTNVIRKKGTKTVRIKTPSPQQTGGKKHRKSQVKKKGVNNTRKKSY